MKVEVPTMPLSLRDYFAAQAMQSLILHPAFLEDREDLIAKYAYRAADAMLAIRSTPKEGGAQ